MFQYAVHATHGLSGHGRGSEANRHRSFVYISFSQHPTNFGVIPVGTDVDVYPRGIRGCMEHLGPGTPRVSAGPYKSS